MSSTTKEPQPNRLNFAVQSSDNPENLKAAAVKMAKRHHHIIFYVLQVPDENRWVCGCEEDILYAEPKITKGDLENAVSRFRGRPKQDPQAAAGQELQGQG